MTAKQERQIIVEESKKERYFFESLIGKDRALVEKEDIYWPHVKRIQTLVRLLKEEGLGRDPQMADCRGLEVGCGQGALVQSFSRIFRAVSWCALEHPDRQYLRLDSFRESFRQSGIRLETCDLLSEPVPFADEYFDVVVFSEIIEHLPVLSIRTILKELRRILKPGGLLAISTPNQASLSNRLRFLKGHSLFSLPVEVSYARGTFGHIRLYTLKELREILALSGFSVAREFCLNCYLFSSSRNTAARRLLSGLVAVGAEVLRLVSPEISDALFIIGKKSASPAKGEKT